MVIRGGNGGSYKGVCDGRELAKREIACGERWGGGKGLKRKKVT